MLTEGDMPDPFGDKRGPLAIARLKDRIDGRLNDYLCEMKPDYDDSITGFNEAWDIVRKAFAEVMADPSADTETNG